MNTAVITWGRMNPPTIGHEKVVNVLKSIARDASGIPLLFVSKSENNSKNPLSYRDKIRLLKTLWPDIVQEDHNNNIVDIIKSVSVNYSNIIMVVGSDRIDEFNNLFERCIPKHFHFDSWKVVSAGSRKGDSITENISGTKMRHLVSIGDFETFKSFLPEALYQQSKEMFEMMKMF